jgi:hypothetical protein
MNEQPTLDHELSLDDLQPWALRAFEDAYQRRSRDQASRDDIAYGFVQALFWAHVNSAFRTVDTRLAP